ncbi:MAG: TIR domain-containing protein [Acidobacteriota bacterium]
MADLFLSYAREDRACAELLATALSSRGWTVWWDRRIQVGRSFSEVIERELEQARCVIVLWSRHSLASDWVQNEAAEAARKKSLVPVRIEDVRPPLEFRRLQTADLFNWQKGFESPEFDACLASIEMLVGNTAARPLPSRRPTAPGIPTPQAAPPPPQVPQQPAPQQPYPPAPQQYAVPPPIQGTVPNYLIPAILVTIGCCLPLGIAAIVYAAQVNTKLAAGDVAGAKRSSDMAKRWCWIAFFAGIAGWVLWFAVTAANQSF